MKFGILINDLTADEARTIINDLGGLKAPNVTITNNLANAEDDSDIGTPATGAYDSAGLPWDERIHAGTKTQNKDGTWKKKKGVQPVEIETVEAELRFKVQNNVQTSSPAAPVALSAPVVQNPTSLAVPTAAPQMPSPVPATPIAAVPLARDYSGLMTQVSNLFRNNLVDGNYPNTIVSRINAAFNSQVIALTDIGGNPHMVDYAWQCLDVDGKAN